MSGRIAPAPDLRTEFFWTGGKEGELRFQRCEACRSFIHPPQPRCPDCLGEKIAVEVVSGRARVGGFTVNHQPWLPNFPPPYVIAIVEIEEAPEVRLTTNIVGCDPEEVYIGMPLEVEFEEVNGMWLPLFHPAKED